MKSYLSQMTFMYFDQLEAVKPFFEDVLNLEKVFEPEWAVVYKVCSGAYLGAVDASRGSIDPGVRGGTLISLTVDDVMSHYDRIASSSLITQLTEIKEFEDIGVKSFFFKGPQGYDFEIQTFTKDSSNFTGRNLSSDGLELFEVEKEFCIATALEGAVGWARYFAEDGKMLTKSGKTIDGKTNIENAMKPLFSLDQIRFEWQPINAELSMDKTLGYTYGQYTREYLSPDKEKICETGMYMSIWRKQADGSWRIAIDGGN
ncbi:MAG TPA: hypothetical protein DCS67_06240 [Clostridiales bacterium UBA8960]|jgi:uncharacterized protein (TIGR02246 family)|nr:hypothetical protein [Clostridiales bacterium UBA8960]